MTEMRCLKPKIILQKIYQLSTLNRCFFFHQLLSKTAKQSLLFLPASERRVRRGDWGRTPVARERLRVFLLRWSFAGWKRKKGELSSLVTNMNFTQILELYFLRIRLAFQVSKWETRMLKWKLAVGHRRIIASWISMSFSFHLSELVDLY